MSTPRKSYFTNLSLERTGMDLRTLVAHLVTSDPDHTAQTLAAAITQLIGERYSPENTRYVAQAAGVALRNGNEKQKRGGGWLQQTVAQIMAPYMRHVGIRSLDYPHAIFFLTTSYPTDWINLGDLVQQIGAKACISRQSTKNMQAALSADVAVERFFLQGIRTTKRGVIRRMRDNNHMAHKSIQGQRIRSVVQINENTSLMVFDDGRGVLLRPDVQLGNVMRVETQERVRTHLEACMQISKDKAAEAATLLEEL